MTARGGAEAGDCRSSDKSAPQIALLQLAAQMVARGSIRQRSGLDAIIDPLVAEVGAHRHGRQFADTSGLACLSRLHSSRAASALRTEPSWIRVPLAQAGALAAGAAPGFADFGAASSPTGALGDSGAGPTGVSMAPFGGAGCGASGGTGRGCSAGGSSLSTAGPVGLPLSLLAAGETEALRAPCW